MNNSQIKERITIELQEINNIVENINQFYQQIISEQGKPYESALANALALNLHSFYTAVERIFELIATKIDYSLPSGERWHRKLLDQMSVEIPEVRKAVISSDIQFKLEEFRRFRHVVRSVYRFRHVVRSVYAYQLETNKVLDLVSILTSFYDDLIQEINKFLNDF